MTGYEDKMLKTLQSIDRSLEILAAVAKEEYPTKKTILQKKGVDYAYLLRAPSMEIRN